MAWRAHGHARVDPKGPDAWGVCDRDGMVYNRRDLVWDMQWRGPRLMKTGFLVCQKCADRPQEQLRPRILPTDPVPIFDPRPELFTVENGLQGFTLYTILPPDGGPTAPAYPEDYVLDEIASVSGITPPGLTDYSSAITASQVPQALFPADPDRSYILLFNPDFLQIAVSFKRAGFREPTSIVLSTGQALLWSASQGGQINLGAMTVVGFDAGQSYYALVSALNTGLVNDDGVLQLTNPTGYPTSPLGLRAGAVWNNGLAIGVIPGIDPDPLAPPVLFGSITAPALLILGGGNLPLNLPAKQQDQLWNNGGEIAIASSLSNDSGWLTVSGDVGYPTSFIGLLPGDLWNNGGLVSIIPGSTPNPAASPVLLNAISGTALLALGGGNLPTISPALGSGQLWNSGDVVCVA